jgi:hypothetical protein
LPDENKMIMTGSQADNRALPRRRHGGPGRD